MKTCTKRFPNFPFAHRQHKHDGHCALIHGHNWHFEFTFGCEEVDGNGFVIDFGKLKWLKLWLEEHFDHTLVLNSDDPSLGRLKAMLTEGWPNAEGNPSAVYANIIVVPNCSCEGLADWLMTKVGDAVMDQTDNRVHLLSVTVFENENASATVSCDGIK